MTSERLTALGHKNPRRNAIWPWLVMPLAILAIFWVLHDVRRSSPPGSPDTGLGSGIP